MNAHLGDRLRGREWGSGSGSSQRGSQTRLRVVQECDFDQEPGCTEWYQAAGSHAGQTNKSIGHSPDRLIANGKKKRMISSGDNGSWRLAPGYVLT